jgi:hypothetical protein
MPVLLYCRISTCHPLLFETQDQSEESGWLGCQNPGSNSTVNWDHGSDHGGGFSSLCELYPIGGVSTRRKFHLWFATEALGPLWKLRLQITVFNTVIVHVLRTFCSNKNKRTLILETNVNVKEIRKEVSEIGFWARSFQRSHLDAGDFDAIQLCSEIGVEGEHISIANLSPSRLLVEQPCLHQIYHILPMAMVSPGVHYVKLRIALRLLIATP